MKSAEYQGRSLKYLAIEPDGFSPEASYPLVILLHGFGAGMHDLAGLTPAIDREGYLYACPNAPLPFQVGLGQTGYGWTPPWGKATAEDKKQAREMLGTFFDEVMEQYHVSPGKVVLMGFSQGGSMTYRCGLPRPETFAGLASLSSSLQDQEELRTQLPQQRTQPIFISHGVNDDIAPVDMARQAKAFLEGEGYTPWYREYPMKHEISQEVLDDLIPWVKDVLPPLGRQ